MNKTLIFLALPIYILGLIYLSLPVSDVSPLPNSFRSTEPGDTWQHPEQSAYYTDLTREEVLDFYQDSFSVKFNNTKIPSYRLNYPPEETAQYVREQILSYYLEEIIYPFKGSLFVSGWNPRLSPITDYLFDYQYDRWALIVNDQEYQSKVTIKPYPSKPITGYLIWTSIFPLTYLIYLAMKHTLSDFIKTLPKLYA
jgi:hypothetical protein